MKPSTFAFLTKRGVRNLGKHWAMTIAAPFYALLYKTAQL